MKASFMSETAVSMRSGVAQGPTEDLYQEPESHPLFILDDLQSQDRLSSFLASPNPRPIAQ
jgi:hypothetical protein